MNTNNDAAVAAERAERAKRLRRDRTIRIGLEQLHAEAFRYSEPFERDAYVFGRTLGACLTLADLDAILRTFDYLSDVPEAAFHG